MCCVFTFSVCSECEENRNKITKMQEDLSSKEHKWTAALSKLQEQVDTKRTEQDHQDAGGSQQQGTKVDSCPF
jgi:Skp family chaperone for outer membrane proteins